MNDDKKHRRSRSILACLLAATVVAGLASRRFADAISGFLADHAGDALWTLAAYLGLALLFPRARIRMIATGALGISFLVEFSQLLDWPWLAAARQTVPGSLLLGHGFLAIDLLRYAVGTTLGVVLDLAMIRLGTTSSCSSSGHTRRD